MTTMSQDEMDSELIECARYGEEEDLVILLKAGAKVNSQDVDGNTSLHKAAANGHIPCLRLLKDFGAVYLTNKNLNSPLHWAVQNSQLEASAYLLQNFPEIDVLAKNSYGRSVLTDAFQTGNSQLIDLCLSHPSSSEENLIRTQPTPQVPQGENETLENIEAHAVVHKLRFDRSSSIDSDIENIVLTIRELPITRADNPFGNIDSPEDDTTGLGLWPASLLLSRWVADLSLSWQDKVVLELGAGCGLPALTAALTGAPREVFVTDVHEPALRNAVHNLTLNGFQPSLQASDLCDPDSPPPPPSSSPSVPARSFCQRYSQLIRRGGAEDAASTVAVSVTVKWMSWQEVDTYPRPSSSPHTDAQIQNDAPSAGEDINDIEPPLTPSSGDDSTAVVDVILGSDLVYDETAAALLAFATSNVLLPGGSLFYVAPDSGRAGMDSLIEALSKKGLTCVEQKPCPLEYYKNPLCSGESDEDNFVLHFYDMAMNSPFTLYHFRKI